MRLNLLLCMLFLSAANSGNAASLTYNPSCSHIVNACLTQATPVHVDGINYTFDILGLSNSEYITSYGLDFTSETQALNAASALLPILNTNNVQSAGFFVTKISIPFQIDTNNNLWTIELAKSVAGVWSITAGARTSSQNLVVASPVPIPAAAYLFLTGLAGIFGLKKVRARAAG